MSDAIAHLTLFPIASIAISVGRNKGFFIFSIGATVSETLQKRTLSVICTPSPRVTRIHVTRFPLAR